MLISWQYTLDHGSVQAIEFFNHNFAPATNYQEDFAASAQLDRSYAGWVERVEQNVSMQKITDCLLKLIDVNQIAETL